MIRIAFIADDLTGANDSGVQLAESGIETTVSVEANVELRDRLLMESDALVFNTDSRWMSQEKAYNTVFQLSEKLYEATSDAFIYKKIDSTLRGNIGAEMDAMYDAWNPDFIAVVPAYPKNGRIVKEGTLYVHGVPLDNTEMAHDPSHPIADSYVPNLFKKQTERPIGTISLSDIRADEEQLIERIRYWRDRQVPYIVFDAEVEDDLVRISQCLHSLSERIIWSGSAGLAQYIRPVSARLEKAASPARRYDFGPVLTVIGSVNIHTRRQLQAMLYRPDVKGVELKSERLLDPAEKALEMERVLQLVASLHSQRVHIVIYTSGDERSIKGALAKGHQIGLEKTAVTREIADALGQVAAKAIERFGIRAFVMTGGDTAKQVFTHMHITHYQLVGQLEAGIPIGRLDGSLVRYFITKAGGFGTNNVLLDAIRYFERGEVQ